MATITNTNTSTKVIRIQDDEKELLFRLREIYGSLTIVVVVVFFYFELNKQNDLISLSLI
jgi:hypothetical protein